MIVYLIIVTSLPQTRYIFLVKEDLLVDSFHIITDDLSLYSQVVIEDKRTIITNHQVVGTRPRYVAPL